MPYPCPVASARPHRSLAAAVLVLAAAHVQAQEAGDVLEWSVVRGDTLSGLQQRLLHPARRWQDLQRHNRIADPRRLRAGQVLAIPLDWLRGVPLAAQVLQVSGEASLHREAGAGGERQTVPLVAGATLHSGDGIQTGARSSAGLVLGDGSQLVLRPSSRIVIESSQSLGERRVLSSRLRVDAGSVDTRVPPPSPNVRSRIEIVTPVVNLGVRGTVFRSHVDEGLTLVEVLEGQVDAAAQRVAAGQGLRATRAGAEPPRPLLPPPDLSTLPPRWSSLQVPWGAVEGAAYYRAQVVGEDGVALREALFAQAQARWDDALPDGSYRLAVRAVDAAGLEGRDALHPFDLRDDPPPLLRAPVDGQRLEGDAVEFDWRPGAPALPPAAGSAPAAGARWRLQVAGDAGFASPLSDLDGIASAPARVSLPPGRHHWRLARRHADGSQGPWSTTAPFELVRPPAPLPPPPVLQPPSVLDGTAQLAWRAAVPGRVRVQVGADEGFAGERLLDIVVEGQAHAWQPPAAGRYWVRVAAVGDDGQAGPFGDPLPLEIDAPSGAWWLLVPLLLLLL